MSITLDSYLIVNEWIGLHLYPSGADIQIYPSKKERFSHHPNILPTYMQVNRTAREVLQQCNGTKTVGEIIKQLRHGQSDGEYDVIVNGVLKFVEEALGQQVVTAYQSPISRQVHITGSAEYYMPQHMSIELTSNCNLRCVYCYRDAGPGGGAHLPIQQLLPILEALAQHGVQIVELTGGEPLLHPDVFEILDFCAKHFAVIGLLSNGTLIDDLLVARLVPYMDRVFVQVDLDGSTSDLHDYLRGVKGAFERTKQGIILLARYGIRTRVAMNLTKDNVHDIENTLLLAKSLGATWFGFSPILDIGRGKDMDLAFTAEQLKRMGTLAEQFHEKHGDFFRYIDSETIRKSQNIPNCGAGHRTAVMGPTGKVRPCLLLPEEYLVIGDLTLQSVEDVFSNPVTIYLHDLKYPKAETCGDCEWALYCRYCVTRAILTQEKLGSPCPWAQKNQLAKWITLNEHPATLCTAAAVQCSHGLPG